MQTQKSTRTVRRSVALPEELAAEVIFVAPPELKKNFNRLVLLALSEFVANRKNEAFAQALAQMAADPCIVAELTAISCAFSEAETDGLPHD
jgi:hypothetical protein